MHPWLFIFKAVLYFNISVTLFALEFNITMQEVSCNKSRQFFHSTWGIITDGPTGTNYTQDSHCEWLIKAQSKKYITLTFQTMETECSYDYLFVYDGDTLKSPLLGSFSGKTVPQQITAESGAMLILLYSDANYVLDGFRAEYSITDCPRNCSNHGLCINQECQCEYNWGGSDCSFKICPDDCGSKFGRGVCSENRCQCFEGYSGQACDLNKNDMVGNSWHWLSSSENGLTERAAHTAVYIKETDSLYVFGGYNLNKILGDFAVYNFNKSTWEDQYGNSSVFLSKFAGHHDNRDESVGEMPKAIFEKTWFSNSKELLENLISSSHDNSTTTNELNQNSVKFRNLQEPTERAFERIPDKNLDFLLEEKLNSSSYMSKEDAEVEEPSARYGHAACKYPGGFALYGGKSLNGNLSDELWFYNLTTRKWSLRAKFSHLVPPKLTRHTLTLVGNNILYLFGGSTIGGEFSSKMFSIKLSSDINEEQWNYIRPRGGKDFDLRLVGHTTVYSSKMNSLIVYGGVMAGLARLSKLSDKMFLFKISSRFWSEIHYPRPNLPDLYIPRERAFHTSVILGNYLVVFGGYSHRHNKEEICYDNEMYLYHLGCHTWVNRDVLGLNDKSFKRHKKQGVFAHAADVRNGNTLLVFGGYHGNVNADFWAYVMPPTLASREGDFFESEQICGRHKTLHECTSNPECGWCSADEICYGRTVGVNCTTNLQTKRCPGLCPALEDCHSCLIHGEAATSAGDESISVVQKLKLEPCIWCVQNARCHHKDDNYGVCGLREGTLLQIPSWWGSHGTEITSVDECRIKNRRPGLTFINYKYPMNTSQPDYVSIINATAIDFDVPLKDSRTEVLMSGAIMTARFVGFLRIPNDWENVTETLKMCASFSNTIVRLSRNHLEADLEVVGNISAEATTCKTAYWRSGSTVVLRPGRYLVDFESKKSLNSGSSSYQQSKMALMHNRSHDHAKVFTFEYLEPYYNGSCATYTNCLQCLTDSLCGWCDLRGICQRRDANESELCSLGKGDWRYLTLQPSFCVNCSNYISCELCLSTNLCEWWVDEAKCSRRGSGSFAVQSLLQCPVPCHLRQGCNECVAEKGRCVWCEARKECFSFSVYTSEYQFGLCREWIDQSFSPPNQALTLETRTNVTLRSDQCKSCSRSTNCSTCLQTLSCGWCYEIANPILGTCVPGDFNKPEEGLCNTIIGNLFNKSLAANETSWSYASCPDVDECELQLDNCHPNATCTNTPGSYTCLCKRGYYGDGRMSCTRTCYDECIHGTCTMAPDYKCNCSLGWTGEDCSIDCGCNNHSTCNQRVGVCDECQDWTTGEFCQYCKIGSYGNATSERKCRKCECNNHEDEIRGFCDSETGACFCKDNTEGNSCEKCVKGYYGDATDGGTCYYQCVVRGLLKNVRSQGIGSYRSSMTPWETRLETRSPKECLWILNSSLLINSTQPSLIQLTIDGGISISCEDNSLFAYEGLPDLDSLTYQNHVLGTFCQRNDKSTLIVETKSGILTVLYKQGESLEGFNATYRIFSCPDHCPAPRVCINHECVCQNGWVGPNCSLPLCHNNCSFHVKQGLCNKGYGRCNCSPGYGSSDCSVKIDDRQIIFTELFNSAKLSGVFDHLRKMIPRFGHSLVTDRRGSLWMFGGYSLSHGPLNDIRLFDTKNNTWMQVTVDSTGDVSMPQGRYFHAAEIVHSRREIYVFGGIGTSSSLKNGTLRDFWKFNIKHQRWMDIENLVAPPPVAGHTLTLMKDLESENLFLIGGFSPQHGFLTEVWVFSLEMEQWSKVKGRGRGPQGIFGHSSVYHSPTHSFYIYGGYEMVDHRRIFSKHLYSLYYPTMTWSPLPTFEEYNPADLNLPQPRFLHSAITTKDYMLVFGGKIFQKSERSQTSDLLMAYSYSCNQWIRLLHTGASVVGSLPPMTYAQAMTYDPETEAIYVVGGFDNTMHSEVTRINLPLDLCNLWARKDRCRSFLGCSFCSVVRPDKTLTSYCYSSIKSLKESCDYYNGTLITNNGVVCDSKWFQHRSCENFKTCADCLAKWPVYFSEEPACKWCSNCSKERCVPYNHTCRKDVKCESTVNIGECAISANVSDSSKWWTNDSFPEEATNCLDFKDCSSCLSHKCRWSTALKECISSDYQPLFCAGGICGLVLKEGKLDQCPQPCSIYKQCATCLKNYRCGWCSYSVGNYSGEGLCTEGSLDAPLRGDDRSTCDALLQSNGFSGPFDGTNWNYISCPEENECTNGHHTCNPASEICQDLPEGFQCICNSGYKFSGNECEPVCSQGCIRGKCVQPDECQCDFGYVGVNCSIQCQCNGHSNCAGPDKLNQCLECHNNTMGAQCERCKPLFVGDPTNNGKCVPCFEYCNRHTNVCVNDSSKQLLVNKSVSELIQMLEEGPMSNALCVGCLNKTTGRKCHECQEGYFRGSEDLTQRCRPCECHGHGDRCDPVTGEKCNCANNTESECQPSSSKNSNQQCWMLQCSKCKETYSGNPTDGHQCYKQMTLDHKFCLNSKLLEECKLKLKPLYPGQSVFFQVQPRYVNVDIRVFIDVVHGSLDLFMSLKDDSLVVITNSTTGEHILEWDQKYKKRFAWSDDSRLADFKSAEKKVSPGGNWSYVESPADLFYDLEKDAEGFTSYITINKKNNFLHVKNIRGRLVLTLPKDKFDLISTRFYLGLVASTQGSFVAPTYGILFFRQDQLHIDLFVFFSVFFSCFFLFLAACVVAWKAKQAADIRRARRRHVVEMLHMAKRPFARVLLHLDSDDGKDVASICSQSPQKWKRTNARCDACTGETRPVAIEPTDDGAAAIATFFVRLPGGPEAPVQLSLASSLIMVSRTCNLNNRVFLRRRCSHHAST